MNIHTEVENKRNLRKRKIADYANEKNISFFEAAIFIDFNSPLTTNKRMLNDVGIIFDEVNSDNVFDIIDALGVIGVKVRNYKQFSNEKLADILNNVISEKIPECWGGEDMQEYVDLGHFS